MLPHKDHYGMTRWTMIPSMNDHTISISAGTIENSDGFFRLPEVSYDVSLVDSISIVHKEGVAYYVFWQPGCVMDEGFNHMVEFAWKEGNTWFYAENEDSGSDY